MRNRSGKRSYVGWLVGCVVMVGALAPTAAYGDSYTTAFEPPAFSPGDINTQSGWSKTNPAIDGDVFAHTPATDGLGLGAQSLRVSNEVASLGLRNQIFSPSLVDAAGESGADGAGQAGGARQSRWEASLTFASFQPTLQTDLTVNFAPDRGDGSRMGNVIIADTPQGLSVTVLDVIDNGFGNAVGFPETEVASGLDRTKAHSLGLVVDFVEGPANDVLRVYVDGALVHTSTSWEQYYRNDPEQAFNNNRVPATDSLLVAVRTPTVPANAGKGLFVDDVAIRSSTATVTPPPSATPPPPAAPAPDVPAGTPGADNITGGSGDDRIDGGAGNDRLNGGAGNDALIGGIGNDRLFGASGNDNLSGGTGNDRVAGGDGNDRLGGGTGADIGFGGGGNDRLFGDSGNDRLFGDKGNDRFSGGTGNDNFSGGSGNDLLSGDSGKDLLSGNGGTDTIRGGSGNDTIKGRDDKRDTISCGSGKDAVAADREDRVAKDCERVKRG